MVQYYYVICECLLLLFVARYNELEENDKLAKEAAEEALNNNSLYKKTRAEHYEMLYQKVMDDIVKGKCKKKKITISVSEDLWRLAGIEAAFQEKPLSEVVTVALINFIKINNGN